MAKARAKLWCIRISESKIRNMGHRKIQGQGRSDKKHFLLVNEVCGELTLRFDSMSGSEAKRGLHTSHLGDGGNNCFAVRDAWEERGSAVRLL